MHNMSMSSFVATMSVCIHEYVFIWHVDPVDNPTSGEGFSIGPLTTEENDERDFQNPLYSGLGPNTTNPSTQNMYEGLYSESTMASETLYENPHNTVPGTLTNGGGQTNGGMSGATTSEAVYDLPPDVDNIDDDGQANGGMRGATTSEAVYDVPPDVDNVGDDNSYSSVGPSDSWLQPPTLSMQQYNSHLMRSTHVCRDLGNYQHAL